MKRVLATIGIIACALLGMFVFTACDTDGGSGGKTEQKPATSGLEYELVKDTDYYRVSKGSAENETTIVIPSEHDGKKVKIVKTDGFADCANLVSVELPDTIEAIGSGAFAGCSKLASIKIPDKTESIGNEAFKDCINLSDVEIGENASVGKDAFAGCDALKYNKYENGMYLGNANNKYCVFMKAENTSATSFTVHADTKVVVLGALAGCDSLQSLTVPFVGGETKQTHTAIGYLFGASHSGYNEELMPQSLKTVKVTGGKKIGSFAFSNCIYLTSIEISSTIETIEIGAFSGCERLTGFTMPNSVTQVGNSILSYCKRLESVTLSSGLTQISEGMFRGCEKLTSVSIPAGVKSIGKDAFNGCTGLTSVSLPTSVNKIGECAFWNCKKIDNIALPSNVTEIGEDVFYECESLSKIVIPKGVDAIRNSTFAFCRNLTDLTLPNSVKYIESLAFIGCYNLSSVKFDGYKSEWNAIDIDPEWYGDFSVVCKDGTVSP